MFKNLHFFAKQPQQPRRQVHHDQVKNCPGKANRIVTRLTGTALLRILRSRATFMMAIQYLSA
jgi:hypothetical protein